MVAERQGVRVGIGTILVVTALPIYLSAAWWRLIKPKLNVEALGAVRKLASVAPWWLHALFIFGVAVLLSRFVNGFPFGQIPTEVPSSVRLLIPPTGEPKELEKANVLWQAFPLESTGWSPAFRGILDLAETDARKRIYGECVNGKAPNTLGLCEYRSKSLVVLLQFEKPTIYKNLEISISGQESPQFKIEAMTSTYAVISFPYYPSNQLIDVKTAN